LTFPPFLKKKKNGLKKGIQKKKKKKEKEKPLSNVEFFPQKLSPSNLLQLQHLFQVD